MTQAIEIALRSLAKQPSHCAVVGDRDGPAALGAQPICPRSAQPRQFGRLLSACGRSRSPIRHRKLGCELGDQLVRYAARHLRAHDDEIRSGGHVGRRRDRQHEHLREAVVEDQQRWTSAIIDVQVPATGMCW